MNPIAKAIDCFAPLTVGTAKAIKAEGISAVGRYVGHGSKCLTPSEVSVLTNAGLPILSIFETNPTYRTYFARERGVFDAKVAVAAAQSLGQPAGTPIYFAVDFDAQDADMPAIRAYFEGIKSAIGVFKVGVYGGLVVVSNVAADFYWQTMAWSGGRVSPRSAIYQNQCDTTVAGVHVDVDVIYKPCGWWPEQKEAQVVTGTYPTYDVAVNGQVFKAIAVNNQTYVLWTAAEAVGSSLTDPVHGDGKLTVNGKEVQGVIYQGDTYLPWGSLGETVHAEKIEWNFEVTNNQEAK